MKVIKYTYCETKTKITGGYRLDRPSFQPKNLNAIYQLICCICGSCSPAKSTTPEKYFEKDRITPNTFGFLPDGGNSWIKQGRRYYFICNNCEDIYTVAPTINYKL